MKQIQNTLSPREIEIAQLKMMGMTNREIAIELEIGERTVRFHIHNIYRKLKVPNTLTLNYVYGDQIRPIYPNYLNWFN